MQRNILRKLKKIIISLIFLLITMQSVCFADFTKEQQETILNFAKQVSTMNTAYTQEPNALVKGYLLEETYSSSEWRYWNIYMVMLCNMGFNNIKPMFWYRNIIEKCYRWICIKKWVD